MNWKLWIATPLTLGLGLWFAHIVIPRPDHDRIETPACTEHDNSDLSRPTLLSRAELPCDPDPE